MDAAVAGRLELGPIVARIPREQIEPEGSIELPALGAPKRDKTEFECPPGHLDALRADLNTVKRVLIVGWRAAEAHVVNLLNIDDGPARPDARRLLAERQRQ